MTPKSASTPKTAMVFAAGLGTRMRPLTEATAKPLIEVAGVALIDHVLDALAAAGVETAVVNTHWFGEAVERHVAARARPRIVISDERAKLLDQGGGIKKALPALGEAPCLIANTDAFWVEGPTSNIRRLAEFFDPERMDAALLVAEVATSVGVEGRGDFTMDADGRLTRRAEGATAPFVYTGVAIAKPALLADDPRDIFPLAPILFDMAARGRLWGVRLDGLWLHVGTPAAIADAERAMARAGR